jgi:hypothetical protein
LSRGIDEVFEPEGGLFSAHAGPYSYLHPGE